MRELRQALRSLWRDKGFTAIAVTMLALGIGANSALFSLLDALALRPLPYERPDELVDVTISPRAVPLDTLAQARSVVGVGGFQAFRFNVAGPEGPANVFAYGVSPGLFPLLGARAVLGRTLQEADAGQPVVMLAYEYWRAISEALPSSGSR